MTSRVVAILLLPLLMQPLFFCCSAEAEGATQVDQAVHACCQQAPSSPAPVDNTSSPKDCHCKSGGKLQEAPASQTFTPEPGSSSATDDDFLRSNALHPPSIWELPRPLWSLLAHAPPLWRSHAQRCVWLL